jgi:Ran-binding protein 1
MNSLLNLRAKVYRFDREKKEWKERGSGNIKILHDKEKSCKVRVLMWRERVLTSVLNHRITSDMKVDFYQSNPKILSWSAVDHSEDVPRPELLTCRFGNEEKVMSFCNFQTQFQFSHEIYKCLQF